MREVETIDDADRGIIVFSQIAEDILGFFIKKREKQFGAFFEDQSFLICDL